MKHLLIIPYFLLALISFGQAIEERRMQQDIEVSEAILNELFNPQKKYNYLVSGKTSFFFDRKIAECTGVFIENYGVIFKVPPTKQNSEYIVVDGKKIIFASDSKNFKLKVKGDGQKVRKIEADSITYYYIDEERGNDENESVSLERLKEEIEIKNKEYIDKIKTKIEQFFISYADLIGGLNATQKIMIVYQISEESRTWPHGRLINNNFGAGNQSLNIGAVNLIAEIKKADLTAFKTGQLSEEEFVQKIIYASEKPKAEENELEYEVLSGVFLKLFDNINFTSGGKRIQYERLQNFGVIYQVTSNPFQTRFNLYLPRKQFAVKNGQLETIDSQQKEEDANRVEAEKQELIKQVAEYMVQYGRTLRNLGENEILMLDIALNNYNQPSTQLKFTITKAHLNQYDKGEISFEEATASVIVKEY